MLGAEVLVECRIVGYYKRITHEISQSLKRFLRSGSAYEVIVMYAGSICERGTADAIFYHPAHEYTKGLMRSIPRDENNGQRLKPITGTPIDLLNMPKGCPFAPRCDQAMKICLTRRAEEMWVGEDHISSCWMNVRELAEREKNAPEGEEAHE